MKAKDWICVEMEMQIPLFKFSFICSVWQIAEDTAYITQTARACWNPDDSTLLTHCAGLLINSFWLNSFLWPRRRRTKDPSAVLLTWQILLDRMDGCKGGEGSMNTIHWTTLLSDVCSGEKWAAVDNQTIDAHANRAERVIAIWTIALI